VALLLPLNFAALAWTPERRVAWRWMKLWTVLLVVEIVLVALLVTPPDAPPAFVAWRTVFDAVRRYWATLGLPLVVLVAGAFVLAFVRFMLRPRPLDAGLVWALVISWLALGLGGEHLMVRLFLATGGLIVLVALIETSYALAYTDDLTGLPTRRALDDLLSAQGSEYVVAMVDIDHFKKFNDQYGHQSGDDLLRKIGTTLMRVRGGGRPFRYGGEEFAVVFPGTAADEAIPHLEALRDAVAATRFTVRAPDRPRKKPRGPKPLSGPRRQVAVTVSIGVADTSAAGEGPADVIRAADTALYRAKRDGRNRLAR
jgi:diguanylate cyclase (GGDEF)-like protein